MQSWKGSYYYIKPLFKWSNTFVMELMIAGRGRKLIKLELRVYLTTKQGPPLGVGNIGRDLGKAGGPLGSSHG